MSLRAPLRKKPHNLSRIRLLKKTCCIMVRFEAPCLVVASAEGMETWNFSKQAPSEPHSKHNDREPGLSLQRARYLGSVDITTAVAVQAPAENLNP